MSEPLLICAADGECPCPTSHRRLEAVHLSWHRALDEYQDAELFTIDLNSCIQALRNVTFALQKEMAHREGFRDWYDPWQAAMRQSQVLRWVVDARNSIVKEGDLATSSSTRATVVFDYYSLASLVHRRTLEARFADAHSVEIRTPALAKLPEIQSMASERLGDSKLFEDAILVVERRWVADSLPSGEVLDAVATAFSFLASLIRDADLQFSGAPYDPELDPATIGTDHSPYPNSMRPPCMRATHEARTTYFKLASGDPDVGGFSQVVTPDRGLAAEAARKYGAPAVTVGAENALDFVPEYTRSASLILRSGQEHGWFGFYFRGPRLIHAEVMAVRDRADKWRTAARIAATAARLGADGFINIGEVWIGTAPADGEEFIAPVDQKDRREAVVVEAAISSGDTRTALVPFSRNAFGMTMVQEPDEEPNGVVSNFLEPLLTYWRHA